MSRGVRSTLVGRSAELAALRDALEIAVGGRAVTVVVSGDAGVGKTRLLDELAGAARARGCAVLLGSCVETTGSLPYVAAVDALRGIENLAGGMELLREEVSARPALGRLLPHVAQQVGTSVESFSDHSLAQVQLFDGVHGILRRLAETAPLVVIIEDVHWADQSTRDLLAFLDRTLRSTPIMTVLSYRSDDLHRRHPLRPLLAELARRPDLVRLTLNPLDRHDAIALAEGRAGHAIAPALLDDLHRRSEGNPFFLESLVDAAGQEGARTIPAELADVLITRVETLPDQTRSILRAASIGGRRVDLALLAEVIGETERAVETALAEAVTAGLVLVDGSGYAFRHALVQEAVSEDLLPGESVRLHGAYARQLSARAAVADRTAGEESAGGVDGPFAGRVAAHRLAAHDLPGAFDASVAAARHAESVAAPAEALGHLETALSLLEPLAAAGHHADRLALLRAAADAAAISGEPERAVAYATTAVAEADVAGDLRARAMARARLALLINEVDIDLQRANAIADEAVALYPPGPPSRDRALVLAASARMSLSLPTEVQLARLDRAIAEAYAASADDIAAEGLITRARLIRFGRLAPEPVSPYLTALDLVPGTTAPGTRLRALRLLATELFEDGLNAESAALTAEGLQLARSTGLSWSGYGLDLRLLEGWLLAAAGEWDSVLVVSRESGIPPGGLGQVVATLELQILVLRGDPSAENLLARLSTTLTDIFAVAQLDIWEMELALLAGETGRVYEVTARRLPILLANGGGAEAHALSRGIVAAAADDAEAARARGQDPAVHLARAEAALQAQVDRVGGPQAATVSGEALWSRTRAEYARARGPERVDEAVAAWQDAVAAAEAAGRDYETALASWRLGEALLLQGCRGAGTVAALGRALAIARRLQAQPLLERILLLARQSRLSAELGLEPEAIVADLTPRELDVLRLVVDGLSNRAIGKQLFISEKTASVHVSNIMAKTGAGSRTEAAAIAVRRGLLD